MKQSLREEFEKEFWDSFVDDGAMNKVSNWWLAKVRQARLEALEEAETILKKEMRHESPCQHQEPRGVTANEYNCADIHIGRKEGLSDAISALQALKDLTPNE